MASSSTSLVEKGKGKEVGSDPIRSFVYEQLEKAGEGFEDLFESVMSLVENTNVLLDKVEDDEDFEKLKKIVKGAIGLSRFIKSPVYRLSSCGGHSLAEPVIAYEGGIGWFDEAILPTLFGGFREFLGLSESAYFASVNSFNPWHPQGGKSKCFFGRSVDNKFIIKEIHPIEFNSFKGFAERYVEYMKADESCLSKILGIYKGNGRPMIVMENLSYGREISRQYDIKGVDARVGTKEIALDYNLIFHMQIPLFLVNTSSKSWLLETIRRDTGFLETVGVMDYSLFLVMDEKAELIACGIIDYLRPYTFDKKLESFVKSLRLPRDRTPTIIAPDRYGARLRSFLDKHLLTPDNSPVYD